MNESVSQINCMIEEKRKDEALFHFMEEVKVKDDVKIIDGSSCHIK
ncbi:hypothetical protein [Lederbergia citrea]|nr:hypothetical protein [Lederbergia citrea]MBS4177660.1 hypothetical protein [Lederbergia citrea]